jgi:hypothetical protein
MGGVDGFVGDGAIRPGAETSFDAFYSVAARRWFVVNRRLPTRRESRIQRGPWPREHLYREDPWGILDHFIFVGAAGAASHSAHARPDSLF